MWSSAMAAERLIGQRLGNTWRKCRSQHTPCRCWEESQQRLLAPAETTKCFHPKERSRCASYLRFVRRGGDPALRTRPIR